MNKHVYLSPSNQANNSYIIGNTTEKIVCEEIARFLKTALERCDVEVFGWKPTIAERIAESNRIGVDVHMAIHSNASAGVAGQAGTARGVTVFTELVGTKSSAASKAIYAELQKIYPTPAKSRGVQNGTFTEIAQPRAATPYLELAFHDNPDDARWLLDNKANIAEAICKGLCAFFSIGYRTPIESPSIDNLTKITGAAVATATQMQAYLLAKNPAAPDYSALYLEEGAAEGIRGDIAFAQSCIETDYWRFGGDVEETQNNFAGIGATGGGEPGNSFDTPRKGIRAQVQHLKAYANADSLNGACIDPRFKYVTRGAAPYVEWLGIPDNPAHVGWAGGKGYGAAILRVLADILTVQTPSKPDKPSAPGTVTFTREQWNALFDRLLSGKDKI